MTDQAPRSRKTSREVRKIRNVAGRTALIYAAVSFVWILASDRVVSMLTSDPVLVERISIAKGWFFVGVTAALLYVVVRRQLRRIEVEAEARHEAAAALAEQRQRLDDIIEGTHVGTWEWNVQTGELTVNERWAEIVGWPLDELAPISIKTWESLAHPEDLKESGRLLDLHFAGQLAHYDIECRMRHRDGRWVWVHDRGRLQTRDAAGRPLKMSGTHTDVTVRKEAELAQRESEERFRQIAENINEVFWIIEGGRARGRLSYVSPAYDVVWGRSRTGLIGGEHTWSETIHPDDRARVVRAADERMSQGTYEETYRIVQPGGMIRWIHDRAFPLRDAAGQVYRIIGTAEDVTERHTLEEQVRQSQKMQAIGTLAGGIAHDFNNLLGAITGFAEIARTQVRDRPEVLENLDDILRAGKRAIGLVRQILAFSRRASSERVLMQLRPVVEEAVHLLRSTIPTTIEITCDVGRDVPPVVADPTQVHQVIMNLGTNAWHAMRERAGRLELRLERVAIDEAQVRREPRLRAGTFARISVRDTGVGVAPELVDRIFEPFFTTKAPGEGTGLGLSVVHGIVREHEGFITVDSTPGVGSAFHVHLPMAESEVPRESGETGVVPMGRGQRILFVDDEPALVRLGIGMLEALGYTAEGAEGADKALALAGRATAPFDLVVTDQTMPVMTGVALAARIRTVRPELPILIVTGRNDDLMADGVRDLGLGDLLLKPLSLSSLAAAVHQALRRQPKLP